MYDSICLLKVKELQKVAACTVKNYRLLVKEYALLLEIEKVVSVQ
jgi:hypothetical protein